ncbi:MAG TPA: hypothetical protein VFG00_10070 [Acidothermaceae bacterium]|nr:hypothetical protein [Acidothermaceae bacterium]
MKSIIRGVRPLDYILAAALTALGVLLMVENMQGSSDKTRIDSTTWVMIPVFAAATLPILWRRTNLWAVLGVTAAALGVHDIAFGWVVRCGAGLPLAFALAYAVGRLMSDRRQSYYGLAAVVVIQFLVLVTDSAAGLGIIPFTAVISAGFWGVGRYVQKRSQKDAVVEAAPSRDVQLARAAQ